VPIFEYALSRMTEDIDQLVSKTNSLRGALFALREALPLLGGCHIGYEFVIRQKGYVRSDLIAETTLPANFSELYTASGGSTLDPVLSRLSSEPGNFRLNIVGRSRSPFFKALLELGCVSISSFTLPIDEVLGRLAFTIMEDQAQRSRALHASSFTELIRQFHVSVRRHGQITSYLGLTIKECATLTALAHGLSAADVAEEEEVSVRAEL